MSLTFLHPPQMQHQQVGDASVLVEGQAQGWFGLTGRLSVAVYAVGMSMNSIDTIDVAVYTIDSVWNGISCKHIWIR